MSSNAATAGTTLPNGTHRSDWPHVSLGAVVEFIRGVTFDKGEAKHSPADGLIPILRAGNIGDGLTLDRDLVWVPRARVSPEQLLRVGDLAICMSSGSPAVVGKTAIVMEEWHGSVGAFCGIIRPRCTIHSEYLAHWFRGGQFRSWRDGQARGANIQNLRFSQFAEIPIPLPPLPEQERIAARLTEQLAAVDRARAAAQERLAAAHALPAAHLRIVFPNTNSDLPAGWRWRTIREIATKLPTGPRFDRAAAKSNGSVPIVDQSQDGYLGFHDGAAGIVASEARPVVTFANHTCAVRFHIQPFSVIQNVFPLVPNGNATPEYLYWVLKDRLPATFYGGHWPLLTDTPLPFPPTLSDQARIADNLFRRIGDDSELERLSAALYAELATIEALPAALLREAFGSSTPMENDDAQA